MAALAIVLILLGLLYVYSGIANVSEGLKKTLNFLLSGSMLKSMGDKVIRLILGVVLICLGIYMGVSSGAFDF